MSYESIVYRILIASPSDVDEEREVAARVIQDWNDLNSFSKKIVLLPVRWETHSSPTFGIRPQEAINRQIVDDCDLLIGFFWTKIGTPTGEDLSGTIEEIKRVSNAGKHVMLYFSKRGKDPSQIDWVQLQALNKFKDEVYKSALVEQYSSIVEFRDKISRQLEMKIRELQERKESIKEIITFSFMNTQSGALDSTTKKIKFEKISTTDSKIGSLLKKIPSYKNTSSKSHLLHRIKNLIGQKNSIPIVLGLKNETSRIFGNVIVELTISASIDDGILIEDTFTFDGSFWGTLRFQYSEEEANIRKLFKNTLTKTSSNIWEFSYKPFSLLPSKTKALESLLVIHPKNTMSLTFKINLFSENILQPIERSCILNIDVREKTLTIAELEQLVEQLPEEEMPF